MNKYSNTYFPTTEHEKDSNSCTYKIGFSDYFCASKDVTQTHWETGLSQHQNFSVEKLIRMRLTMRFHFRLSLISRITTVSVSPRYIFDCLLLKFALTCTAALFLISKMNDGFPRAVCWYPWWFVVLPRLSGTWTFVNIVLIAANRSLLVIPRQSIMVDGMKSIGSWFFGVHIRWLIVGHNLFWFRTAAVAVPTTPPSRLDDDSLW